MKSSLALRILVCGLIVFSGVCFGSQVCKLMRVITRDHEKQEIDANLKVSDHNGKLNAQLIAPSSGLELVCLENFVAWHEVLFAEVILMNKHFQHGLKNHYEGSSSVAYRCQLEDKQIVDYRVGKVFVESDFPYQRHHFGQGCSDFFISRNS